MIRTGIRIEGTRLFRIVRIVTMEIGTTWPNSVVLGIQWDTGTTLSDDATGEGFKKTCLRFLDRLSFCRLRQMVSRH